MTRSASLRRFPPPGGGAPWQRFRCGLCKATEGSEEDYARHQLANPSRRRASAEAIADAIGFCPAHGAFLAGLDLPAREVSATLLLAARLLRGLLQAREFEAEDRRLHLFFHARRACPVCAQTERSLAAPLANRLGHFRPGAPQAQDPSCAPHFFALVASADAPSLLPITRAQIALLRNLLSPGDAVDAGAIMPLIAGSASPAHQRQFAPIGGVAEECPVCAAAREAHARWIAAARLAARVEIGAWTVMPSCPAHLWACAASDDERLAVAVVRHAVEATLQRLEDGAKALARGDVELEAARQSVWYRRKNPAYLLGKRRKTVAGGDRCRACERLDVARERATYRILDRMREKRYRDELQSGYGLCVKHFAQARIIAPSGIVRDTLTAIMVERLAGLESSLEAAIVPSEPNTGGASTDRGEAWREALFRLSGSSAASAPEAL